MAANCAFTFEGFGGEIEQDEQTNKHKLGQVANDLLAERTFLLTKYG